MKSGTYTENAKDEDREYSNPGSHCDDEYHVSSKLFSPVTVTLWRQHFSLNKITIRAGTHVKIGARM